MAVDIRRRRDVLPRQLAGRGFCVRVADRLQSVRLRHVGVVHAHHRFGSNHCDADNRPANKSHNPTHNPARCEHPGPRIDLWCGARVQRGTDNVASAASDHHARDDDGRPHFGTSGHDNTDESAIDPADDHDRCGRARGLTEATRSAKCRVVDGDMPCGPALRDRSSRVARWQDGVDARGAAGTSLQREDRDHRGSSPQKRIVHDHDQGWRKQENRQRNSGTHRQVDSPRLSMNAHDTRWMGDGPCSRRPSRCFGHG